MKELSGREMLHVGTPRWGGMNYWPQTLPTPDLTDNIQSRKQETLQTGFKKKKNREREITDSSQNPTEALVETHGNSSKHLNVCQP